MEDPDELQNLDGKPTMSYVLNDNKLLPHVGRQPGRFDEGSWATSDTMHRHGRVKRKHHPGEERQ